MAPHQVGTRQEWLAERLRLLGAEKELTSLGDQVDLESTQASDAC